MKKRIAVWLPLFMLFAASPAALAQVTPKAPATKSPSAQSSASETQKKNIQAYIELMRTNVRDQKAEIMGSVMALNAADAAKFWPIYSEYDTELSKVNDLRIANIKEYAANYSQMTDEKADELFQNAGQLPEAAYGASRKILWPREGSVGSGHCRSVRTD